MRINSIVSAIFTVSIIATSNITQAALMTGDVLKFSSNSYFGMDTKGNSIFEPSEQYSISSHEGIIIGTIQISLNLTGQKVDT